MGKRSAFIVTDTTNLILDIDGYFTPVSGSTLAFYALPPCRVADTRNPVGPLGGPYLSAGQERDFPILSANLQLGKTRATQVALPEEHGIQASRPGICSIAGGCYIKQPSQPQH